MTSAPRWPAQGRGWPSDSAGSTRGAGATLKRSSSTRRGGTSTTLIAPTRHARTAPGSSTPSTTPTRSTRTRSRQQRRRRQLWRVAEPADGLGPARFSARTHMCARVCARARMCWRARAPAACLPACVRAAVRSCVRAAAVLPGPSVQNGGEGQGHRPVEGGAALHQRLELLPSGVELGLQEVLDLVLPAVQGLLDRAELGLHCARVGHAHAVAELDEFGAHAGQARRHLAQGVLLAALGGLSALEAGGGHRGTLQGAGEGYVEDGLPRHLLHEPHGALDAGARDVGEVLDAGLQWVPPDAAGGGNLLHVALQGHQVLRVLLDGVRVVLLLGLLELRLVLADKPLHVPLHRLQVLGRAAGGHLDPRRQGGVRAGGGAATTVLVVLVRVGPTRRPRAHGLREHLQRRKLAVEQAARLQRDLDHRLRVVDLLPRGCEQQEARGQEPLRERLHLGRPPGREQVG
mmetsp:Transcript_1337/g.4524  ORF Transcript_1337/g.4524 Transcript_1337/m.4524 type:complete len:461 (+) Transcript_1337:1516-2898(+)